MELAKFCIILVNNFQWLVFVVQRFLSYVRFLSPHQVQIITLQEVFLFWPKRVKNLKYPNRLFLIEVDNINFDIKGSWTNLSYQGIGNIEARTVNLHCNSLCLVVDMGYSRYPPDYSSYRPNNSLVFWAGRDRSTSSDLSATCLSYH